MLLNNRQEMQTPPSASTPQGRAGRLLVQQKEEAKERVKQHGRTTRSECGHSRPGYLSLRLHCHLSFHLRPA